MRSSLDHLDRILESGNSETSLSISPLARFYHDVLAPLCLDAPGAPQECSVVNQ